MSDVCALPGGPPSLARDVLASVDCFITGKVEATFANLLAPGGSLAGVLTVALTIYVAIYGYRLALGLSSLSLAEVVPHFVRIGLVVALATNWPAYQRVIFNLLFDGPQQIAGMVMTSGKASDPNSVIVGEQRLFDAMTDYAGIAWAQRSPTAPPANAAPAAPTAPVAAPIMPTTAPGTSLPPQAPPAATPPAAPPAPVISTFIPGPPQFVAIALWISALLMMASSIGLLLIVRIILAMLLIVGPVFIALGLFAATRGLSEGWLRAALKFALVPVIVLPLSGVLVTVLTPFVMALQPGPITAFRDTPALAILIIVIVFAVVLSQALSLTDIIAGAFRLPKGDTPAQPTAAVATTAAMLVPAGPQASRAETIVNLVQLAPTAVADGAAARSRDLVTTRTVEPLATTAIDPDAFAGRLGQGYRRVTPRAGFANSKPSGVR